ncbi:Uncharacterised protein [Vibrio cholerae]|nr:Uncharacterised protein [Vibrio cholerae]CSC73144.1 Uncharacterised protein [Vibrio cholerae]
MNVGLKTWVMRADFAQHFQEIQHRARAVCHHFTWQYQWHAWRIRQDHIGAHATHHLVKQDLFSLTAQLLLPCHVWRHFHLWQHIERFVHQLWQLVFTS